MERLKTIKDQLISEVQGQMGDLRCVDTKELGEVIDMIYDLSKSIYYCTVVKAMEEGKEERQTHNNYYYTEKYLPPIMMDPYEDQRDYDYFKKGRMYYGENSNSMSLNTQGSYREESSPTRDSREGRSGMSRKMYMESKQTNQDQAKKIQELDTYMKELTSDIIEMIQDASPEEKAILQKKISILATKVQNV